MKDEENLWFNADNLTKLFTFLGLQVKIWTTSSGPVTFVLPSWHRHLGKFEEIIKLKIYSFSFFLPYIPVDFPPGTQVMYNLKHLGPCINFFFWGIRAETVA